MASKKTLITETQNKRIQKLAQTDPVKAHKELQATIAVRRAGPAATKFTIDAIAHTTKRKRVSRITGSMEQDIGTAQDAIAIIAHARDLFTNFGFGKGIVKQHLKSVIGIGPRIKPTTGDLEYNKRAAKHWNQKKDRLDIRGVLSFTKSLKIGERSEAIDGDFGIILVRGGKTQFIEADRIADPPGDKKIRGRKYVNGVEMNRRGVPLAYHIHTRGQHKGQKTYQQRVPAENFIHAHNPERFDQVRGISWFVAALNDLRDLYETVEAVKGKWKIENMIAIAIKSALPEANDLASLWGTPTEITTKDANDKDEERFQVKLGQGVHSFELLPGEDIQIIESKTPNNNFEPFTMLLIRFIALALEMPLEIALQFFSRGGYSAHRSALLQYHESVIARRKEIEDNRIDRLYRWVISRGIKSGELDAPAAGEDEWAHEWQWPGLKLLDPDKERRADQMGYKLAVTSLDEITARDGLDWKEVATQRIEEVKFIIDEANKAGVPVAAILPQVMDPGQDTIGGSASDNDLPPGQIGDD